MIGLGDLPGGEFVSTASHLSTSGAVVVGWATRVDGIEAFRWTMSGGMEGLGDLPGGIFLSRAMAVTGDGNEIVGMGNSGMPGVAEAFRWTTQTGMVGLGFVPGSLIDGSQAFDVSHLGGTIVGHAWAVEGLQAMLYTDEKGMVSLGDLPGGQAQPFSFAFAVSADGQTIVGRGEGVEGTRAVVWDQTGAIRDLQEMLEVDFGLDLPGWQLNEARGVSSHGRTIVGHGTHNGIKEAWVVRLTSSCPADLDDDGIVGFYDLQILLTTRGPCDDCADCPGDLNGDCVVDNDDVIELVSFWGPC